MTETTTKTKHAARLLVAVPEHQGAHWVKQHAAAVVAPRGAERAIIGLLRGWLNYADTFSEYGDDGIGADYYAGPHWEEIGRAIVPLLSMECGRLDCGTLDGIIRAALVAEGFAGEW